MNRLIGNAEFTTNLQKFGVWHKLKKAIAVITGKKINDIYEYHNTSSLKDVFDTSEEVNLKNNEK